MVNPTGYTALDLVGFTDKGPYSSLENYVKNDLAHYAGSIWKCKIDDTTGITPTEGANWTIFISEPSNQVETSIAPIETSPATAAHTVGTQLYYNDTLYKVKAAIAVGDSLVVDTNIELADNITTQLAAKANTSDLGTAAAKDSTSTIAQGSTDLIESGAVYSALGDKANTADLGTAAAKNSTNAVTQSSTDLVESGAVYSELSSVKQALSNEVETRAELGAHNLLEFDIAKIKAANTDGSWSGNTYTRDGISFALNNDGSVTVSGTYTTGTNPNIVFNNYQYFKKGSYLVNGCPNGGGEDAYYMSVARFDTTATLYNSDDAAVSLANDGANPVWLGIFVKKTLSTSITFKPQIRLSTDSDPTYQPYAMTNRELTESVKCLVLSTGSTTVNALPYTFTNANIENDMVCINSVLSNPTAQTGDWTVTTSSGTAQITGTISGATTITLYLMKSR